MRNAFLAILALLAGVPLSRAQQPASAPPNPYAQAQANGYYAAATGQPNPYAQVQPVQYPYGYYGSSAAPGFANPPQSPGYGYNMAYGYDNGYGVNYFYVQNPLGNSSNRPTGADGAAAPATPSWPQPIQNLPPLPAAEQVDAAGLTHAPALGIKFRRACTDYVWADADYTASFMRPMRMNGALVTTGSVGDPFPGAIGQPNTSVLFGNNTTDFGLFSGFRTGLGVFLDRENHFSLDLGGFYLLQNTSNFFISGDENGNPVITRPYYNVADGFSGNRGFANTQNSPNGQITGSIAIDMKSELYGLEFNARYHSYIQDRYHVDLLGGFRYLRLDESLQIREQVNALNGTPIAFAGNTNLFAPDFITDQDNFHTVNTFYGPQVGARLSWEERWFTVDAFTKLAMGVTVERTDINGATSLYVPGQSPQTVNGGVLALPSNSGSFSRSVFGIVPEFGLDLSVNITQNMRVKFGYSFLYWNHVVRPGSQYDLNINPGQVPSSFFYGQTTGPASPGHRFNDEVFWTNSFNLGLEVHF